MPGRASPIAPSSWAIVVSARRSVWRRSLISGRPSSFEQRVGRAGELADPVGGVAGLADRDPRLGERRGDLRPALGERAAHLLEIVEDAGDRFLVAVGKQFGEPLGQRRDAFEQLRRGVEQLAERARLGRDHRHAIGAFGFRILLGAGDLAARAARWPGSGFRAGRAGSGETPVKPTPRIVAVEPSSTGVSSLTVIRTRMNCGLSGTRLIEFDLADRDAREGDRRTLGEPFDRLLEEDVVGLLAAVADLAQPDDEQRPERRSAPA